MHEGTIAQSILSTSLAAANGHKIKKIFFRAGALAGIEKESLLQFFAELKKGTLAEQAELIVEALPAKLTCVSCGRQGNYDGNQPLAVICQVCGGENSLTGGQELFVESIEAAK